MTTDDTARRHDADDVARLILEGKSESDGVAFRHLCSMAQLWLMRESLIEGAHQFWDVEHADPDESQFEAWKARIKALGGE